MASKGGKQPGAGRPKGSKNKWSVNARDNIVHVFEKLGGPEHMADWASENATEFYKIYARLIPVQVSGEDGGPIKITWSEK